MSATNGNGDPQIAKFLVPAPREQQDRAVERTLNELRQQFRFTEADRRRLRAPRNKRPA